ncbi:MAG: BamA/TamA family outer membrane protein [Cytophagaceae bacterium]|nr:BamA/TamA family outer membrane protein [Cytophagaceae bacterium]
MIPINKPMLKNLFLTLCMFLPCEMHPALAQDTVSVSLPQQLSVSSITVTGNRRTKEIIILSELTFAPGDTIRISRLLRHLERSRQNVLNTSLFNFVNIDVLYPDDSATIAFTVNVHERWYIWPMPIFEAEGRNFSDFLRRFDGTQFNYGIFVEDLNFRGRRETLSLRLITGYKNQIIFNYSKPAQNNRSGWGVSLRRQEFDQIPYTTGDDKQVFLKMRGKQLVRHHKGELNYFYRHHSYHYHRFTLMMDDYVISDSLHCINPSFLPLNAKQSRHIGVRYNYIYDNRDFKPYPLSGNYFDVNLERKGLGIVSDYMGFTDLQMSAEHHTPVAPRFFYGTKLTLRFADQKYVPYVFNIGLGYTDFLNGFEYRIVDGTRYASLHNKLLFELLSPRKKDLKFIPLRQFSKIHYAIYLKLNADAGYVYSHRVPAGNRMPNSFLFGYGVGIDFVTFYDIVLGINYSRTNFGDSGVFFHFNLGL